MEDFPDIDSFDTDDIEVSLHYMLIGFNTSATCKLHGAWCSVIPHFLYMSRLALCIFQNS